ncbi:MAG: transposase [Nonlabens sp.]
MSSGVQRNKSDKTDAMRIARYARRFSDRARIESIEPATIEEIRLLLSERELYVKERAKYKAQIKDLGKFIGKSVFKDRKGRMGRHIKLLTRSIEQIDMLIDELMSKDDELSRQQKILTSIDGVGQQVAIHTIMATRGFRKYRNGREFACHVGVAPFSFTSGTSQRSRNKVSNRANKKLKTLFHMAALSAIRMKGEFKDYFDRKVAEGKNKMSVINAVRAKIINRIFALIRENRTYVKNREFSL